MIKIFILTLILFTGCSFSSPQNKWQYKSTIAFKAYQDDFLQDNIFLSYQDLQRSIEHAKSGDNFEQLAYIYLSTCALNKAVGINDSCKKYLAIKDLQNNIKLNSYYNFLLLDFTKEDINNLPNQYKDFAIYILNKDYHNASKEILEMKEITSKLISATLIKEYLDISVKQTLVKDASFYGYRKAVLFWLKEIRDTTKNLKLKELVSKKIGFLKSKVSK